MQQGQSGYFEQTYNGPYKGINASMPENLINLNESPDEVGFLLRSGELRTRPRLKTLIPRSPDGQVILGLYTFIDGYNVTHTICLTKIGVYQLNPNFNQPTTTQYWNMVGNYGQNFVPNTPFSIVNFMNKVYFSNGANCLFEWEGIDNQIDITNSKAGGYFLGELASHLIMCSTTESGVSFGQRVRWSASGLPTIWDPAVDLTAGYTDLIEVPDIITGFITIGRVGLIFRTNGVTEMTPTGQNSAPFDFNHLWASDKGIGNIYPQSITNYGSLGIFTASDDIYKIGISSLNAIGGVSRNAIYNDISSSPGPIIGSMVPVWAPGYSFLTYILSIPIGDGCRNWVYSVQEDNWTPLPFSKHIITSPIKFIAVL